jgi:mannonate dehydratase
VFELVELLEPDPEPWWAHLRQVGVRQVVSLLEAGEQRSRWLRSDDGHGGLAPQEAPPKGERCWELPALTQLADLYASHGFQLVALEDTPPLDLVRLGRPGRDEQVEWLCDQITAMGRLGISTLCYNWMCAGSWARTDVEVPARGGARTTGYDHEAMRRLPPLLEPGEVTAQELWRNLAYLLEAVVPTAEAAGVRLALHPDDPPVPEVRGVPRIINSIAAYDRLLELDPSEANGITLCQGNFTLMTGDLPAAIRRLGHRVRFVHFRDVRGTATSFVETFHDEGQTDLVACMEAYCDIGFSGIMRPDHVPTLEGESNHKPGYAALGRLHALGFIQGLRQAAYRDAAPAAAALDVEAAATV